MDKIIDISPYLLIPNIEEVIKEKKEEKIDKFSSQFKDAIDIFLNYANIQGIIKEIDKEILKEIIVSNKDNDEKFPLKDIYIKSQNLCLYVITLGEKLENQIDYFFKEDDYILGYLLDTIASVSIEKGADILEEKYLEEFKVEVKDDYAILRYSPGYCGWHISTLKSIWGHLNPERIGITLNEKYMMYPLKSEAGIFVYGHYTIHDISPKYPCCKKCKDFSCKIRYEKLLKSLNK